MSVILCYLKKALGETHDQMITFQKLYFPAFFFEKTCFFDEICRNCLPPKIQFFNRLSLISILWECLILLGHMKNLVLFNLNARSVF